MLYNIYHDDWKKEIEWSPTSIARATKKKQARLKEILQSFGKVFEFNMAQVYHLGHALPWLSDIAFHIQHADIRIPSNCMGFGECGFIRLTSYYASWLPYWGRDKVTVIFQTTFSNAFSSTKMFELWLEFHWHWFLSFQLTINHHWFR